MKTLTVFTSLQDVTAILPYSLSILTDAFYTPQEPHLLTKVNLRRRAGPGKSSCRKRSCAAAVRVSHAELSATSDSSEVCLCADSVLLHLSGGSKCLSPFMNRAFQNQEVEKHTSMHVRTQLHMLLYRKTRRTHVQQFAVSFSEERTGQLRVKGNFCLLMLLLLYPFSFQLAYTWILFDYFKKLSVCK